jgi:2-(1,2-epoxy-1,2-dihydrophenyl)acetyl-CoA isomerase
MLQPARSDANLGASDLMEEFVPDLLETIDHGVAVLTLNRPEALNALSMEIRHGLLAALARCAEDDAIGCIVLTGAGRGFCAGGDVKSMAERSARGFEPRAASIQFSNSIPLAMKQCPKVIIGMINGVAVGAGMSLALACDLRVAAASARFGTGFVKLGLSGDWGGTWSLTQLVGTAKARELFFLGDIIGAEEALSAGLVNRVVDDADLQTATMSLARRIADQPLVALRYAKRNLNAAETEPFATVLDMEAFNQARCSQT